MQAEKLARAKNIEFRAELPGVPLCTIGDEGALRRLLLIVIDNAVKYTKEGQVTVRLLSSDGVSQVQVSDTGVGIASGDLPRIFERFYRADQSRSRDSGGAGLGLAIAKWIVEAHHGSIEAQSRPHQGSTFLITLPLAQDLS
jgi:signal transduction histidine kinase